MPAPPSELAASTEMSRLGIMQLKRYWAKAMANRQGRLDSSLVDGESDLDTALLSALNLGLEPTIQYLYLTAPTFAEFEDWIQATIGGLPNAGNVVTFNAQLSGTSQTEPVNGETASTLSADDLVHWDRYGYVVVKNAVPWQDCDQTVELICDFLAIDRHRPDTWYNAHPGKQGIMVQLFQHPLLTRNRESSRIRRAYEQLWGSTDLWVTTDRVGFNPPETTNWSFPGPRLHWDVRPVGPFLLACRDCFTYRIRRRIREHSPWYPLSSTG
ncbi:hypothetical protein [Spirosoma luteum]|uniref:hypothetical protein n=1 Tax=Spirosoma luteum TaxID=431553 RepID=UPI0003A335B0|nr:hypothetical protein [Spirosoma luteum]